MDRFSGEFPPTPTETPARRKSVKTMGGTNLLGTISRGLNAVPPENPPKYISPVRLLAHADQPLRSIPGRPSAMEKFLNFFAAGSNSDNPTVVLIHKCPN